MFFQPKILHNIFSKMLLTWIILLSTTTIKPTTTVWISSISMESTSLISSSKCTFYVCCRTLRSIIYIRISKIDHSFVYLLLKIIIINKILKSFMFTIFRCSWSVPEFRLSEWTRFRTFFYTVLFVLKMYTFITCLTLL